MGNRGDWLGINGTFYPFNFTLFKMLTHIQFVVFSQNKKVLFPRNTQDILLSCLLPVSTKEKTFFPLTQHK